MSPRDRLTSITAHKGGNLTQKYITKNPISRYLVSNFSRNIINLVNLTEPFSIHDVGCGEGQIINQIENFKHPIIGSDISQECLDFAKKNLSTKELDINFINKSVYDLEPSIHAADLVICCEVLEHLEHPEDAMDILTAITIKNLILSVPREPLWRILNICRFKYLSSLGNTPGHIQHWSKKKFIKFVSNFMYIEEVKSPLPWTMLLCKPKT